MPRPRPRLRPRFDLESPHAVKDVLARAREELAKQPADSHNRISGVVTSGQIELYESEGSRVLWSPQLTIKLAESTDGSALACRFGPHPNVWTLYVAIHATGALLTLGAAIYGLSQHLSAQTPWALWMLPAAPLLATLVWSLAFVGQSLSFDSMVRLRKFAEQLAESD